MPNNNGTITAPVSIADVSAAIGHNSYDLGTLCQSPNIKMWSKYKPVKWANLLVVHTNSKWWKAEDGKCGIDFTNAKASNYTDIISKFTSDGLNGWKYNPPTGGTYPFRLLDFENYLHTAEPMIGGVYVPQKVAQNGTLGVSYDYNEAETVDGVPASLTFDDIDVDDGSGSTVHLSSYKFGIVVTDTSNNYKGRVLNGTGGTVEYDVTGLYLGNTYKVYPVLSQKSMGQYDDDVVNVMYTLPNSTPQTFTVVSKAEAQGLVIELLAEYQYTGSTATSVKWTLNIVNTSNSSKTFNSNYIQCKFTTSSETSSLVDGEFQSTIANFTVAANNGSISRNGTFSLKYSTYPNKEYYVLLFLNYSEFVERMDVDAEDIGEN